MFATIPLVLMVLFVIFSGFIPQRMFVDNVSGTVADKYIKRYDTDIFHVVVLLDGGKTEVFQNRDAQVWWWKFNSADVQAELEVGKSYRLTVVGWRFEPLSRFRNIVKVEEVPSNPALPDSPPLPTPTPS